MSFDFCCDDQMVESEFGVNNMHAVPNKVAGECIYTIYSLSCRF